MRWDDRQLIPCVRSFASFVELCLVDEWVNESMEWWMCDASALQILKCTKRMMWCDAQTKQILNRSSWQQSDSYNFTAMRILGLSVKQLSDWFVSEWFDGLWSSSRMECSGMLSLRSRWCWSFGNPREKQKYTLCFQTTASFLARRTDSWLTPFSF